MSTCTAPLATRAIGRMLPAVGEPHQRPLGRPALALRVEADGHGGARSERGGEQVVRGGAGVRATRRPRLVREEGVERVALVREQVIGPVETRASPVSSIAASESPKRCATWRGSWGAPNGGHRPDALDASCRANDRGAPARVPHQDSRGLLLAGEEARAVLGFRPDHG